ncbi:MAG TPA: zinc ribbon domain-containing protein, partial [Candidatus Saccharimonadales bacterium]
MNCSKCHHALDADAAFCGNCGQPVAQAAQPSSSPIEQVIQNQPAAAPPQPLNAPLAAAAGVPAYAVALPGQHSGDNKAVLALLFGIAGIVGALFIVLLGLVLGLAGLIMGTMSRSSSKRGLSTAGLVVSSVAILGSLGVWAYAVKHYP